MSSRNNGHNECTVLSSPALAELPPEMSLTNQTNPAALPDGSTVSKNAPEEEHEPPTIDIVVNNVVCSFATRCHLNLKRIALEGINVVYKKENGVRYSCWTVLNI